MSTLFRSARFAMLPLAACCLGAPAFAQNYPNKPITMVVPFTAGSATDVVARVVGEYMAKDLGQPVITENRPGAGGTIGSNVVAKAEPDGYTLLIQSSAHAANPALYDKLPYDTLADFAGITTLATLPNVLITSSSSGYKSVADLVSAAKKKPGQLNYASAGSGSATHINAEKFRAQAQFDALHIPYKGTPQAVIETVTKRVDFMFAPLVSVVPQIKDGKLLPLAVGTAKRTPLLPDVPTTIEAGVAASDFNFWVGMLVPAKTPPEIIKKIHGSVSKALDSTEVKARFASLGADALKMSPSQFDNFIKQEKAELGALIKKAGVKAE
ncbi:Bug family tripartite tricarboxylate transporter substrate binding protein [Noviherbaspirillum denitrificans]|uniref:LacI family transcriptional regulator n=1 Tax=Noviherbaspirillum denitrificans TaxID=1968433 RepID=A0A254TE75_9BURK|nr:tripartite tricarboxylate transporter substrate binding protein [Noviherbaspirillum denitrificans]OWW20969.1 LacI family transcriptional regulator [Noviherbaspirillum denitrificans]